MPGKWLGKTLLHHTKSTLLLLKATTATTIYKKKLYKLYNVIDCLTEMFSLNNSDIAKLISVIHYILKGNHYFFATSNFPFKENS